MILQFSRIDRCDPTCLVLTFTFKCIVVMRKFGEDFRFTFVTFSVVNSGETFWLNCDDG